MEINKGTKIKYESKIPLMKIDFTRHSLFIFEGDRVEKPTLDILIKYKEPETRPHSITHKHWAVDMLIKKSHLPELTKGFLQILKDIYRDEKVSLDKRDYNSLFTLVNYGFNKLNKEFINLNLYGEFECELILVLVTLLSANEKNSSNNAYMYEKLIDVLLENKPTIYDVLTKSGVRGK